jgi:hypothetical protein
VHARSEHHRIGRLEILRARLLRALHLDLGAGLARAFGRSVGHACGPARLRRNHDQHSHLTTFI